MESQTVIIVVIITIVIIIFFMMQNKSSNEKSLYDRLGGIYPIAAVVDYFSDNLIKNNVVGVNSQNKFLREWSRDKSETRLQGLKFMRTLWVADITGGPFKFHHSSLKKCPFAGRQNVNRLDLDEAHCPLQISSGEFDEVARELAKALDHFNVPTKEKNEVLQAFAAHKTEVVKK